jgi:putative addiction module killer protein
MIAERTEEFQEWFDKLSEKDQAQVAARIYNIEKHNHFGDAKYLDHGLAELRWENGRRVYFVKTDKDNLLLLTGGLKNAQNKDIKKARLLLSKYGDR